MLFVKFEEEIHDMKAKEFYQSLIAQIYSSSGDRGKSYAEKNYEDSTRYTQYIKEIICEILSNAKSLNKVEINFEYYRVDVFAWEQVNNPFLPPKPSKTFKEQFWKPVAAVEHENDYNSWMDEVIKLSYLKVPLKVVICYLPVNERSSDYKYTNYVSEALSLLGYKESQEEEFLLIIGNAGTKNTSEYFGYKPYLYNSKTMKFELQTNWD